MSSVASPHPPRDIYPGTTRPVGPPVLSPPVAGMSGAWDEDPRYHVIQNAYREFFGTGHLASALGRSTKTIYKWEQRGLFPKATFILNGSSRNGQRRLYTRTQIEGAMAIALEEGVLTGTRRFIGDTGFTARCTELFRNTRAVLPPPLPFHP